MSDTELKPCPFCGSEAELDTMQGFRAFANGSIEYCTAVYCMCCSAQISACYSEHPDIEPSQLTEMVVEDWNKRTAI